MGIFCFEGNKYEFFLFECWSMSNWEGGEGDKTYRKTRDCKSGHEESLGPVKN